jgi:hypothetical protein
VRFRFGFTVKLLVELRERWRRLRRKSREWLFPGNRWHSGGQPIDRKTPRNTCKQAAQRACLKKRVYPPCSGRLEVVVPFGMLSLVAQSVYCSRIVSGLNQEHA